MRWNDIEQCYECPDCGQLISKDVWEKGVQEGWSHCPGCGSAGDNND